MTTVADSVLQSARAAYDIATKTWLRYRDLSEMSLLDSYVPEEADDLARGAKYRCSTPAAAMAMSVWQKRKAELDAAAANVRRERGDAACPTCKADKPAVVAPARDVPMQDSRLPSECDDEAEVR